MIPNSALNVILGENNPEFFLNPLNNRFLNWIICEFPFYIHQDTPV
ncbi:Uncharacterised protein [Mycobacterium tuberculosis]|nr:Uncharacterised protein [Mycobacterium tuberculosis]